MDAAFAQEVSDLRRVSGELLSSTKTIRMVEDIPGPRASRYPGSLKAWCMAKCLNHHHLETLKTVLPSKLYKDTKAYYCDNLVVKKTTEEMVKEQLSGKVLLHRVTEETVFDNRDNPQPIVFEDIEIGGKILKAVRLNA